MTQSAAAQHPAAAADEPHGARSSVAESNDGKTCVPSATGFLDRGTAAGRVSRTYALSLMLSVYYVRMCNACLFHVWVCDVGVSCVLCVCVCVVNIDIEVVNGRRRSLFVFSTRYFFFFPHCSFYDYTKLDRVFTGVHASKPGNLWLIDRNR